MPTTIAKTGSAQPHHKGVHPRVKAKPTRSSKFKVQGSRFKVFAILYPLFSILLACSSAAEPTAAPPIPTAEQILAHLNKAHPRLLLSNEGFAELKQRITADPQLKNWYGTLQKEAEDILGQPPSRYEIPDGLRLLATSRQVLYRTYTLAFLYRMEDDRRYLQRTWSELEAAAKFKDWNPRHFLDTAEMSHAFAIGYDWLYDAWSPEQRDVLRKALVSKGLEPALGVFRGKGSWSKARHNWNQVCNGGIGLGALAIAEAEPALAGELLHDTLESLPLAMAEFAPDGGWKEGPGYWGYATAYNVAYLAGLETAVGTDFGLSQMPGFSQTGLFPLYLTGPTGRTFNYADSGDHELHAPQMFWLARKFSQPLFAWHEKAAARPDVLDLVWFDSNCQGPKSLALPLDKYFRGPEVAVFRSEWEDSAAIFAGLKAGDNKANHSHLDLGSFVFDALGVRWVVDLGADNYNMPGYFGGQRWTYYRLRAEGHNTLVINPGRGPDQDPAARTPILRFKSTPQRAFAITDLTPAYVRDARKVQRGIALLDRRSLLVQDEIQATNPAEVWWFMHTRAEVKLADDGRSAILSADGAQVRAQIISPSEAKLTMMDAQPLPTSPSPQSQAKNSGIRKLAIHLADVNDSRIAVLLTPVSKDRPRGDHESKLVPLSEW